MSVSKPFEETTLQNATQLVRNSNINTQSLMGDIRRPVPVLPPRPYNSSGFNNSMSYGGKKLSLTLKMLFVYK